ncbi:MULTISPECIES: Fic family protein [unclassified Adlercreutzia]|uniref:Fic family protein n=1 Tax=unclassified Adlercreutzia TaxID=2636013 RepID=UPI0013EC6BA2|nr:MULTISPECIES: Fic family protein [unclassified Adlercreutzia]
MAYTPLKKIFHIDFVRYEETYTMRFSSEEAVKVSMNVSGDPAFFLIPSEAYRNEVEAARLDKEIYKLIHSLPPKAIGDYMNSCLIDEIVLTNEIEGVNSTRREIGEVLERLKQNDKRGRFNGLVQKYLMLAGRREIPVSSCEDIRAIYDDLVLDEVLAADAGNAPDGDLFRKGSVSVCDATGIPIHQGIEPESRIKACLDEALLMLHSEDIPLLARLSAFHFLFGYIHPFYDGNGRTNRFISSSMLSQHFEPLVGLRLSYSVKQGIRKYYKAYSTCEHKLNKGDVTPFVIAFSDLVVDAMRSMRDSLADRKTRLERCEEALRKAMLDEREETLRMASALCAAALFADYGTTAVDLGKDFGISRQTVYKRMEPLKRQGLVVSEKVGVKTYYRLDVKSLLAKSESK